MTVRRWLQPISFMTAIGVNLWLGFSEQGYWLNFFVAGFVMMGMIVCEIIDHQNRRTQADIDRIVAGTASGNPLLSPSLAYGMDMRRGI